MSDDLPSIFDEAGRQGDKGSRKKKKNRPVEPAGSTESAMTPLEQSERTGPETVEQMLDRIRKMQEELEEKLEAIDNKSTYLPQHLRDILDNPETVDQQHLARLVKAREEMEQKVEAATGINPSQLTGKKDEKKEKKRGQKSAKLRSKKNWMRME